MKKLQTSVFLKLLARSNKHCDVYIVFNEKYSDYFLFSCHYYKCCIHPLILLFEVYFLLNRIWYYLQKENKDSIRERYCFKKKA